MASQFLFKWLHSLLEIVVLNVRWYCRYSLSYRDLEGMMQERRVEWIAPRFTDGCWATPQNWTNEFRPHLNLTNDSWWMDETLIQVKEAKYLYRAVNSAGNTLDFMLSANRAEKRQPVVIASKHRKSLFILSLFYQPTTFDHTLIWID